jgi:hypothetical protein
MPQYVVTLNLELLCAAENNTDDYNEIECWSVLRSGIWHQTAWLKFTDILEEHSASIFRVEE